MKIEIDTERLIEEAVKYMEDANDVRWSVGQALQELYWHQGWAKVQADLTDAYVKKQYNEGINK
jgi:HEAT repeat protein